MPAGELFFNDKDVYTEYGISMSSGGLSALMTPPPNKELIENKSRLEHGKRVIASDVKIDERELSLPIHMTAKDQSQLLSRYSKFCGLLSTGAINIRTKYQPNVVYRTVYISCTQFHEYRMSMAKFILKLNEPNPMKRNME